MPHVVFSSSYYFSFRNLSIFASSSMHASRSALYTGSLILSISIAVAAVMIETTSSSFRVNANYVDGIFLNY